MTPVQSEAMCAALAKVLAWDARFFKQRPGRQHRIRRAYPAEIQWHQWRGLLNKPIPNGLRLFVGKRPAGAGQCVVGFLPPDTETDIEEEDVARLFAILASHRPHLLKSHAAPASAAPSLAPTRGPIE